MPNKSAHKFQFRPTVAFWKIKALIESGVDKYIERENQGIKEKKVFVIQGGQGAGKTIAIEMLIADFFHQRKCKISVVSEEGTKLRETALNDFREILADWNLDGYSKYNDQKMLFRIAEGWFCEFKGLDKEGVGKGRRRHLVYVNEANKITLKQFNDITSRSDIVIIDYNPNARFWGHDLINDFNFINLTFEDNEFLSKNERNNIQEMYAKGYNSDGTIKNEYWANEWRVYGRGEIGSISGRVFHHFQPINVEKYNSLNLPIVYGIDFGKNHPFVIVETKYDSYANVLYIHELHYKSENDIMNSLSDEERRMITSAPGGVIVDTVCRVITNRDAVIVGDNHPPENINMIRKYGGYDKAFHTKKFAGSNMANVRLMQGVEVRYTNTSVNFDREQQLFKYKEDRLGVLNDELEDGNDHAIQAAMYALRVFLNQNI